ncbi:hypothetical protein [Mucilaginibacter sp. AK015]|uniref:hypothetical protein n=1 Tax=Mucilaginibacter sp. AK015 TaxID=2723072 RepID=UPI0016209A1D|nr:hypothetical protein [Mucilaginibacter sp. AK015]MBB5395059.1 hypothetical protein [Mucilaginibacter sp. AK015]
MKTLHKITLLAACLPLFFNNTASAQRESILRKLSSGSVISQAKGKLPNDITVITSLNLTGQKFTMTGENLHKIKLITQGSDTLKVVGVPAAREITLERLPDLSKPILLKTTTGTVSFSPATGSSSFTPDPEFATQGMIDQGLSGTETDLEGLAEFTLPSLGSNGFNIVPTPTISASQLSKSGRYAFGSMIWANSFGLDSLRDRVGAKMLLPQTSLFGMNFNLTWLSGATGGSDKVAAFAAGVDLNFLLKKVGFLDTATRKTNDFTPFVFHPKLGVTGAFFDAKMQVSFYYNILFTLTENDKVKNFFNTKKNIYGYPQMDVTGVFFMDDNKKTAIKAGLNMIINTADARIISGTGSSVIPYLKIGLLSSL